MKKTIIVAVLCAVCLGSGLAAAQQVPAPSGWDLKGRLNGVTFDDLCSVSSTTEIAERWLTSFGGARSQRYTVVASRDTLDSLWAGLRIKPEKPQIDFERYIVVVIEPGETITQYNYALEVKEGPSSIDFSLQEYHTTANGNDLVGQEAILVFKIPKTSKKINVSIKKAPGSDGPYDK